MTSGSAKTVFWVGTLSSALIFLALTVDFHRREPELAHTDRITDQVVQGKKVWHKYNCNDCHTILGFGGYYAPDMTKAYYRLGEANIVHVVMNPEKVYKDSFRKMPQLGVTAAEAKDLVAFLKWTAEKKKHAGHDVEHGRAYVASYVDFIHYGERIYQAAANPPSHHAEGAAAGGHESHEAARAAHGH